MKIKDAVREALRTGNVRLAARVASICRFKHNMTFQATFAFIKGCEPTATLAQWDELMRASDEGYDTV